MTTNIYDNFRSIQGVKKECYDKRSAAFINTGRLSQDIIHKRLDEEIKAAVVFTYKEGPDETYVYSFIEDDLLKGDYFIYDNVEYLVYEDVKLTDKDVDYKKQRAVECNVTFTHNLINYTAYFASSIRAITEDQFIGNQAILPDETPLLIVPTGALTVGDTFTIDNKAWKIQEYDSITNRGISYLYLERGIVSETVVATEIVEPIYKDDVPSSTTLRPMTEYTFATELGYFVAIPKVDVLSRNALEVTFRVPFGIPNVQISTKVGGTATPIDYEVVL